jgi:hypothetical protein
MISGFALDVFRGRIYQEIRLVKFINWCELKLQQKEGGSKPPKHNYKF